LFDEGEALAGLQRTAETLRAYGERNGLVLRSEQPWPGMLPAEQQTGPIRHAVWSLTGRLPGGAIGRLRHQAAFGKTFGINVAQQHTILVARLPETFGYVPMLCVRPDEFMSGSYYWGGDKRPKQEQKFESIELNRRFVVEVAKGQEQVWLFRLFSPTLIDWLAHETPQDFGFKLSGGVFTCETPQWRGQGRMDGEADPELLDLLAHTGGRVAGRIRDEVMEQVGLGNVPVARSAEAAEAWAEAPTHGKVFGALRGVIKLASLGKVDIDERDDSVRRYGEERGFESVSAAQFHASHIELPLPGVATDVLAMGEGEYLVWVEYSSEVDMQTTYLVYVAEASAPHKAVWLDPEEVAAIGTAEGAEGDLPRELIDAAIGSGYGICAGGKAVALYESWRPWEQGMSAARADAFREQAAGLIAPLR
jgi:hypothetical protein